jgi:hypothetical protein
MQKSSFTDQQLLNLVNNTIRKKSEFKPEDFTGGGVQITSTHNHKIIKHKIYLTFGYDEKRNSISYSEDIEENVSMIWHEAIFLKVKSMQVMSTGSSLSDLNELMNIDSKIEIVDSKIEDRDKECNDNVTTSLRKKPSLKIQIEEKLSEYSNINIEAFNEWMDYKKYKSITPVTKLLNMLTRHDYYTQQEMVDNSIMNNYAGLFEIKGKPQQKQVYQPVNGMTPSQVRDEMAKEASRGLQNAISE